MTQGEIEEMVASARLDPTEEDRSDLRWAFQMSAMHSWTGSTRPTEPSYWLSLLPWSPSFITPADRRARQQRNEQAMLRFEQARRARKPD